MNVSNLTERREAVAADLAALERKQGAALLDGKPFDMAPIIAKRAEIEAIDQAGREADRREAAALSAEDARRLEEIRQEAVKESSAFREALADAEERASALVASLGAVEAHATRLSNTARALGIPTPDLSPFALRKSLSLALGQSLKPLTTGDSRRFGDFDWPNAPRPEMWRVIADYASRFESKETE